jgi:hypothetical protein
MVNVACWLPIELPVELPVEPFQHFSEIVAHFLNSVKAKSKIDQERTLRKRSLNVQWLLGSIK